MDDFNDKPLEHTSPKQKCTLIPAPNPVTENENKNDEYIQDEITVEINGNDFISAFRCLVNFRKLYANDICVSSDENEINYDNDLDLSLDKMKRIFNKNDCINMEMSKYNYDWKRFNKK